MRPPPPPPRESVLSVVVQLVVGVVLFGSVFYLLATLVTR